MIFRIEFVNIKFKCIKNVAYQVYFANCTIFLSVFHKYREYSMEC